MQTTHRSSETLNQIYICEVSPRDSARYSVRSRNCAAWRQRTGARLTGRYLLPGSASDWPSPAARTNRRAKPASRHATAGVINRHSVELLYRNAAQRGHSVVNASTHFCADDTSSPCRGERSTVVVNTSRMCVVLLLWVSRSFKENS